MKLLIVDDEADVRGVIASRFSRRGHEVTEASSGEDALNIIQRKIFDVVITDLKMPGIDGFELLAKISQPTIIITGHGDKESAIKAVDSGAFAFFEKPFDLDALEVSVKRADEKGRLEQEKNYLLKKLDRLCKLQDRELEHVQKSHVSHFIGEHPSILEIKSVLKRLALKPTATTLILGETGTGKEVLASELHSLTHGSKDALRVPFVALNCSAIPRDLFESELFGHEKGAFSGASAQKIGLAEAAREGTLFLDEIGDMAPDHQTKLLRLVQERKFRRVGGSGQEIEFKGRIVAATHKNLQQLSRETQFREDLFYRLSVVSLTLPPLRDRGTDILDLANFICSKQKLAGISPEKIAEITGYSWPGNIRELSNWIERAAILGDHDLEGFVTADLPNRNFSKQNASNTNTSQLVGFSEDEIPENTNIKELRAQILDDFDRKIIENALKQSGNNVSQAAKRLGIDRKNLGRRIAELQIKKVS